jgi:hypothetical protein
MFLSPGLIFVVLGLASGRGGGNGQLDQFYR